MLSNIHNSVLAVKALNQYRKRDVVAYLGLRYYLDNASARRNRWINEISSRLSIVQDKPAYLKTFHFKDIEKDGSYVYRDIYLPTPNEALAETALLTELSKHKEFKPKPYVYSYRFADKEEKDGTFQSYFIGFKERQTDIAKACWQVENGIVLYTDIKRFYPSIKTNDAVNVWQAYSRKSELPKHFAQLGEKLLNHHNQICDVDKTCKGLLTGPLFSHVIANLLLDEIDQKMYQLTNGQYWRYVDDVVLVGNQHEVVNWKAQLSLFMDELELELHTGDKDFEVSSSEWLNGEHDFETPLGNEWISLVADTRRFLIANPSATHTLAQAFNQHQIRLPVIDYSQAVYESSFLLKFRDWRRKYRWSFKAVKKITIPYLLNSAKLCKDSLLVQLSDILELPEPGSIYERKRRIPKIRYLAGRLVCLLEKEPLLELADKLCEYPELCLLSSTMRAVATNDVTEILKMGTNATQAVAQLIRFSEDNIIIKTEGFDFNVLEQSLAILSFNGIEVDFEDESEMSELRKLSLAKNIPKLMNSKDYFIQQFACLHGVNKSRHNAMLDSAFDRDDELVLDIINQLQQSSHC